MAVQNMRFTKVKVIFWFYESNQIFVELRGHGSLKPGLHEPQLPVEKNVTLAFCIVVERHRCPIQVSSFARLQ